MTTAWLLLIAFVGGGCAGILLMALMCMARALPEQPDNCPGGFVGNDPIRLPGGKETFCSLRCRDSFVDANHLSRMDNEDRQFESQYFEPSGRQVG
jgi:hypothetical protein